MPCNTTQRTEYIFIRHSTTQPRPTQGSTEVRRESGRAKISAPFPCAAIEEGNGVRAGIAKEKNTRGTTTEEETALLLAPPWQASLVRSYEAVGEIKNSTFGLEGRAPPIETPALFGRGRQTMVQVGSTL